MYNAARITPVDATTAHQRWVRNVPMRIMNSPTKPFSPGTPIELNMAMVNTPAITGASFWRPLSWEISRVWRRS